MFITTQQYYSCSPGTGDCAPETSPVKTYIVWPEMMTCGEICRGITQPCNENINYTIQTYVSIAPFN